jgi:hypothetical protein
MAEYNNYLYVIRMHTGLQIGNALDLGSFLKAGSIRELVVLLGGIISDKYLLRASLDGFSHDADGNLKLDFKPVCSLNSMFMPNGMDVASKGYLHIAAETFLQTGGLGRVTLHDNSFSLRTALSASSGAYSPNGVDINNDTIYYTDIKMSSLKTYVKKARIVNGVISNPVTICEKPVVTLSGLNLFDDLDYGTYKGTTGVLVANYAGNSLFAVSSNGSYVKEMFKNQIAMPSSCLIGPVATSLDGGIVITEKGMLMEGSSGFGNKVSIAYY